MPYPLLISIPHGGMKIPKEVRGLLTLPRSSVFRDCDAYTGNIYDCGILAAKILKMDIARVIIDANRGPDEVPPKFLDGAVKRETFFKEQIYSRNLEAEEIQILMNIYYHPYHNSLLHALKDKKLRLMLDCHSMSAKGPPNSPYPGKKRPSICLSDGDGKSCPNSMIETLATCFSEVWHLPENEVRVNHPYRGGYITRHYGQNPLPCIQIEMSKGLYLEHEEVDCEKKAKTKTRISELNSLFKETIVYFMKRLGL